VAQIVPPTTAGRKSGLKARGRKQEKLLPAPARPHLTINDHSLWERRISRISLLMRAASREAFSTIESHFLSASFRSA